MGSWLLCAHGGDGACQIARGVFARTRGCNAHRWVREWGILVVMLTTAEALASVPEPEGVTLHRLPPLPEEPGELTVLVAGVSGSAGPEGRGEQGASLVPVGLDQAHDLSWQGPEAWIWPAAGGLAGVMRWEVVALGFIEEEAREAFRAVCDAIDGMEAQERSS